MYFILSLGVLILCGWLITWNNKVLNATRNLSQEEKAVLRPQLLPQDSAVWYLRYYTGVFLSQNLNTVVSVMTDLFYHTVATTIQGLNRLGIRKEMTVEPYPPNTTEKDADEDAILVEGKTDVSSGSIYCQLRERYLDTQTGNVLHERFYKKKTITLSVTRNSARTAAEPLCCLGCGTEIDTSGELFICRNCGTTYRSDSYDWVMGSVDYVDYSGGIGLVGGILGGIIVAILFLPTLLGIFAGSRPGLQKAVVALNLLLVLLTVILILYNRKLARDCYTPLARHDPLSSKTLLARRATYLMRRLYYAHDFDPADIRPVMDEQQYGYFAANHRQTGSYVLDFSNAVLESPHFTIQGGRQVVTGTFRAQMLVLTPERQIKQIHKGVKIALYRNENTRYEQMLRMESFTCGGCGSSLNLTAHGACRYCGTKYNMADFDWVLGYIDESVFDLSPGSGKRR